MSGCHQTGIITVDSSKDDWRVAHPTSSSAEYSPYTVCVTLTTQKTLSLPGQCVCPFVVTADGFWFSVQSEPVAGPGTRSFYLSKKSQRLRTDLKKYDERYRSAELRILVGGCLKSDFWFVSFDFLLKGKSRVSFGLYLIIMKCHIGECRCQTLFVRFGMRGVGKLIST